jgi:NADPH:quinone reductase
MTKEQPLMKVMELQGFGGADCIMPAFRPRPVPSHDEVLIKVTAIGMNRADILQRKGLYPPPPDASDLMGLEISGTIEETGERVCALLPSGGYAEYVTVPRGLCFSVPDHISLVDAAALPEAMMTGAKNIFMLGRLQKNEHVLIHGGASGIGTMAIQMAKLKGARVSVTAGSDARCEKCKALGADNAINYKSKKFWDVMKDDNADVVLDMVGGETLMHSLEIMNAHGRLVSIAYLSSPHATISIPAIMRKHLTLTGSTLRGDTVAQKISLANFVKQEFWSGVEEGHIRPIIDRIFPFDETQKAHETFEKGQHFGKILLKL